MLEILKVTIFLSCKEKEREKRKEIGGKQLPPQNYPFVPGGITALG